MPQANHYGPNVLHAAQYLAIVAYIEKTGLCDFATLFKLFADTYDTAYPAKTFRNRLGNLVERGTLVATGSGIHRKWDLKGHTPDEALLRGAARPLATARQIVHPMLVPPRQHNMWAGTYQPPRGPLLRCGALDAAQLPSRGVRC